MQKEKFEEITIKLKYEKEKWLLFHEIDSILLSSGKGFYPNWKYVKFMITEEKILVRHGKVKPYGARLGGLMYLSADLRVLNFARTNAGIHMESSSFYDEWFRQPKIGDYIRVTEGDIVYGESPIMDVKYTMNAVMMEVGIPIKIPISARVSFYDYTVLASDRENCAHSTFNEGMYMHFITNEAKPHKKYGIYHEEMKIKDIKEINLKVGKEFFNKTYKLE
jgi:hypothetical protein